MADMFFFGSAPATRLSASAPSYASSSHKARTRRRDRKYSLTDMSSSSKVAFMARHDEPSFRSNASLPTLPYFPALDFSRSVPEGCIGCGSLDPPSVQEVFEDDDEPGGVQLAMDTDDQETHIRPATSATTDLPMPMTSQDDASRGDVSIGTQRSVHISHDWPRPYDIFYGIPSSFPNRNNSQRGFAHDPLVHISATERRSSSNGRHHPRPATQSVQQEDEGRRVRLAMAGVGPSEVPQFLGPAYASSDSRELVYEGNMPSNRTSSALEPSILPDAASATPDLEDVASVLAPTPSDYVEATHTVQTPSLHIPHDSRTFLFDEDALSVDDPKRKYYVVDFVETWRQRAFYATDADLPPIDPTARPHIRESPSPCDIDRSDVIQRGVDLQNIDWSQHGTCRKDALKARRLLHLSSRGAGSQSSSSIEQLGEDSAEVHYRFHRYHSRHSAHYEHFQLRNVVAAHSRSDVFYATGAQVMRTSLTCPTVVDTALDLVKPSQNAAGFRVTALVVSPAPQFSQYRSDNVLLAGGFYGEYALLNLDSDHDEPHTEGYVSHAYDSITTHIHTLPHRRSGALGAVFCSNDKKLRHLDIATNTWTNTFEFEHSINCSATSPDGRLRIVVGDSNETLLTDAERGDVFLTREQHSHHAFACAWSSSGVHVATGAQDGKVVVWDTRNWTAPLQTLDCEMTCARSLHFTDDGALVVAESDDVVSIYDVSDWDRRQHVRFFGSIAGLALLDGGREMVVANADKDVGGLLLFERTASGVKTWENERRSAAGLELRRRSRGSLVLPFSAAATAHVFV